MNIVTIGMSPFTTCAKGKLHGRILESAHSNGHKITGLVWGHDVNYWVPKDDKFLYNDVQIFPFNMRDAATQVYDYLQSASPDVIITVGDVSDFSYMKAVKMFLSANSMKWVFVLTTTLSNINYANQDILLEADAILCTAPSAKEMVMNHFPKPVDYAFVGADSDIFYPDDGVAGLLMTNCKRSSQDNLAMVMESVATLHQSHSHIKLYAHTNVHEKRGDYDAISLKNRFDPNDQCISLPDSYVSTNDGIDLRSMALKYAQASVFVSIPVVSATSMTVFEAMSSGCWPVMNSCGSNKDLAILLENHFNGEHMRDDFLVESIPIMVPGESYIFIPDPRNLQRKLLNALTKIKQDEGLRMKFFEFSKRYSNKGLITKLEQMLRQVHTSGPTVYLETV